MKKMANLFKTFLFLAAAFVQTFSVANGKDGIDKEAQSERPGFFKELANTKIVCMKSCPKKIESIFGIEVICENYQQTLYDESCQQTVGHTPVEYCNCDGAQCAKFNVECSADGSACEVKMSDVGISPSQCECNGNSCEAFGTGFNKSSCFMRKELASKTCDIHRMVGFSDGRTYHIACDNDKSVCVSDGVKINESVKVEKLPSEPKPGESK